MQIRNTYISGGFILSFSMLYFFCGIEFMLTVLLALLFHEAGHMLAIRLLGGKISELRFECTGGVIRYNGSRMSYTDELVAALSGPLFSFLLAISAAELGARLGKFWFTLSGVSLVFCIFNMLPALQLDGGRVLYMISARLGGIDLAEKICFAASCAISLAVMLSGVWLLIKTGYNFTLLLCGVWLFCGTAIVKRQVWV